MRPPSAQQGVRPSRAAAKASAAGKAKARQRACVRTIGAALGRAVRKGRGAGEQKSVLAHEGDELGLRFTADAPSVKADRDVELARGFPAFEKQFKWPTPARRAEGTRVTKSLQSHQRSVAWAGVRPSRWAGRGGTPRATGRSLGAVGWAASNASRRPRSPGGVISNPTTAPIGHNAANGLLNPAKATRLTEG